MSRGEKSGKNTMPMFHCSMDDVANCKKDGIRAVVGYVAPKSCWDKFNTRWDAELTERGIEFLHTAEHLYNFPIIGGRDKERDDYLILSPFIKAVRGEILERGGFGVIVITECEAWESLTKAERAWVRPPSRHCFEMLIGAVCLRLSAELSRSNPIAFQIDESDAPDEAHSLLRSFYWLKKRNEVYRQSLGGLAFCDDKMLRSLQAADMLGNLALQGWRRQSQGLPWPVALRQIMVKDESTPILALVYNKEILKSIAHARMAINEKVPQLMEIEEHIAQSNGR